MLEKNKKTIFLNIRIRESDRDLLVAICDLKGWNYSETLRRAVVEMAERMGLVYESGVVVRKPRKYQDESEVVGAIRRLSTRP